MPKHFETTGPMSKLPLIPGYLKCHHGIIVSMGTYKDQEINGILK